MIYILSDVHGYLSRFESILEKIDLQKDDTLYILGDVIDRNPHGLIILEYIMKSDNIIMILGNHEYMMLDALFYNNYDTDNSFSESIEARRWYKNGGEYTHKPWKCLHSLKQKEIFDFLLSLPINIPLEMNGQKYLLVHGKPKQEKNSKFQSEKELVKNSVWQRYLPEDKGPSDYTVIFGHTPTHHYAPGRDKMSAWFGDNLIGIDCGCAYESGRLCCLRLDDMKEFYSDD